MKIVREEIPLARPWIGEQEYKALEEVITSGWLSQGKKVAEFEQTVCDYTGAGFSIATTSCTTSLHLCLVIAGIKNEDEVICPSFSFVASANAIEYAGARPLFVDINEKTFNLDPAQIEDKITPRTKAIVAVHQVGLACDLDKISEIARRHNLTVIEDAACALGATYKGRKIGAAGNYCCFSFHPRKIITTGEGGMITTNDSFVAEKAISLRSHGVSVSDLEKHRLRGLVDERFPELGYNYRMTDLQAVIGIVQMRRLEQIIESRQNLAQNYNSLLSDIDEVIVPFVPADSLHSFQSYLIKIKPGCGIKIEQLLRFMAEHGISCRRSIQPIHLEPYYLNKYGRNILPVTEKIAATALFLPAYHTLTADEQKYIVSTLKEGIFKTKERK